MELHRRHGRYALSSDAVPALSTSCPWWHRQGAQSRPLLFFLLASTLVVGLYLPGLNGGFVFDDITNIVANPAFQRPLDSWRVIWEAAWSSPSSAIGRPLGFLSFAIDIALFGHDPWAMKAVGVMLHVLNAVLLTVLIRSLLHWPGVCPPAFRDRAEATARWFALAWALLAIHVSSVLYVVQRIELLAHVFVLSALLCYLAGRQRLRMGQTGAWWRIVLGLCVLPAVGILAKESAALVPVYALALEVFVLGFAARRTNARRALQLIFGTLIVCGTTLALWTLPTLWTSSDWNIRDFDPGERLLTQARVLFSYLRWIVLPDPGSMGLYHDTYPVSRALFQPPMTVVALASWLGVLLWLLWPGARRPSLPRLGVAWFLSGHLLTSSALPLELVFEHRNYFASIGTLLVLLAALGQLASRLGPRFALSLAVLLLGFQAFVTTIRASEWGDPLRFALSESARNADSPRAQYELGSVLLRLSGLDAASPLYARSMAVFEHAAALPGASPLPEQALLIAAARAGQPLSESWWTSLERKALAARTDPQYVAAFVTLLNCATEGACPIAAERLLPVVGTAVTRSRDPDLLLAYAHYVLSVLRDVPLALRLAEDAVAADPRNPNRHYMLGQYRAAVGDLEGARASVERMRELDRLGRHRTRELALRQMIEEQAARLRTLSP